jgi:hypothetical protein
MYSISKISQHLLKHEQTTTYQGPLMTRTEELQYATKISKLQIVHNIMDAIRRDIDLSDEVFMRRSSVQVQFMDAMLTCVCSTLYKDLMYTYEHLIKEYNDIDSINSGAVFLAPRRHGKSWVVAILIAILLHNVPDVRILIISNNRRSAGNQTGMLGKVMACYVVIYGLRKFDTSNKECIIEHYPDKRMINCISADVGDG